MHFSQRVLSSVQHVKEHRIPESLNSVDSLKVACNIRIHVTMLTLQQSHDCIVLHSKVTMWANWLWLWEVGLSACQWATVSTQPYLTAAMVCALMSALALAQSLCPNTLCWCSLMETNNVCCSSNRRAACWFSICILRRDLTIFFASKDFAYQAMLPIQSTTPTS